MGSERSGFTLVELTAVTATVVVVAAASAPVLDASDEASRLAGCEQMQSVLASGQAMYMAANRDAYAGVNTSGAYFQGSCSGESPPARWQRLLGVTTSSTPVTTWDWISPTVGDAFALPARRSARTKAILSKISCPSAKRVNDAVFGNPPDVSDFLAEQSGGRFRQVSYLQPGGFLYYSFQNTSVPRVCGTPLLRDPFNSPVVIPASFAPRLDKVGTQPSAKVMHACGTRFISANSALNIDITPAPTSWSFFADAGPIFHASNAYGRASSTPSAGAGWRLSFRHFDADLVATFFDGSVKRVYAKEAYGKPSMWYPTGTRFTGGGATPEALRRTPIGTILD